MTGATSNSNVIFSSDTRTAFFKYVRDNPSNRRVSRADREVIVEWLTDSSKRPLSQQEFSRRNYVQKSFTLNEDTQSLLAIGKNTEDRCRLVVTDDVIVDVVESAHKQNGHLGWDATWKDVSTSYYGILRSDVIFLLKQCQVCAQDPLKRPKGSANLNSSSQACNSVVFQPLKTHKVQPGNDIWESANDEEDPGARLSMD